MPLSLVWLAVLAPVCLGAMLVLLRARALRAKRARQRRRLIVISFPKPTPSRGMFGGVLTSLKASMSSGAISLVETNLRARLDSEHVAHDMWRAADNTQLCIRMDDTYGLAARKLHRVVLAAAWHVMDIDRLVHAHVADEIAKSLAASHVSARVRIDRADAHSSSETAPAGREAL